MAVSDPIADMLTKIRNASVARHERVETPYSGLKLEILKILKNEGYVKMFKKMTHENHEVIRVFLKYDEKKNPVIRGIRSISTSGRRVYSGYKKMPRILNGFGTVIVSTSSGVLAGRDASSMKLGGELICSVW